MAAPEGFSDMAAHVGSSRSSHTRSFPPLRITARALKVLGVELASVGLNVPGAISDAALPGSANTRYSNIGQSPLSKVSTPRVLWVFPAQTTLKLGG